MIPLSRQYVILDAELDERHIRASGPGGQHVNTSSTAVQLKFDAANSGGFPGHALSRLRQLAGSRMSLDGVITITADTHRSQAMNREEARQRLANLLKAALVPPKKRRPTKPGKAAKQRRLDGKKQRSQLKQTRNRKNWD